MRLGCTDIVRTFSGKRERQFLAVNFDSKFPFIARSGMHVHVLSAVCLCRRLHLALVNKHNGAFHENMFDARILLTNAILTLQTWN